MPAKAASKNRPEERLVNLVVALMATEQGLTKDTILSSVSGYREQSDSGAGKDALEKMFERDKESLRGLGIPIDTIGDRADPDDLREARYRVPMAEYALPDDIEFTPAEIALLNLAGSVWSESSMSAQARSGLRKIRALGIPVDEQIIGYSPRINLRDRAFPVLQSAIEQSRAVSFPYLKPGEESPRTRHVQPLALVEYETRWHVFGIDTDAAAERTFLLSRIVGDVVVTRHGFDAALREGAGERALAGLEEVAARQSALLEVDPGTEAALRLSRRARPAEQGIHVPYVDVHVFADELASYGPEVRVVAPADLREHVIARLTATLERHGRRLVTAARPLIATDRAALILQLVPYLIGQGEVSIEDAADAFDVTSDQMRTMVEKLTVIGLPGDGGYWQMANDLFDIDWDLLEQQGLIVITNSVGLERSPRLTAREAAALLTGLQLAQTIPGVGDTALFAGLLAKLARGASSAPADVIVASGPVDAARDAVSRALREGVAVSFSYKAPDAPATTRTVDPVKVHIASGQWYLQGWCHLRQAMRTFHLDRVSDLELTDIPITHAGEAVAGWFESADTDIVARVRFPEASASLLGDYLDRAQIDEVDGVSTATMHVADEVSLRRLAAQRGGQLEILEPSGARRAAAEWAAAGLAQYR